jgi:hypothetical protein
MYHTWRLASNITCEKYRTITGFSTALKVVPAHSSEQIIEHLL